MLITKQIVFALKKTAELEVETLNLLLHKKFDKKTNSYTYLIKHPLKQIWAVRYTLNDKYWAVVKKHLIETKQFEGLQVIGEDWVIKDFL
jgi:lambda repressor-like predicted transcriptional regulator